MSHLIIFGMLKQRVDIDHPLVEENRVYIENKDLQAGNRKIAHDSLDDRHMFFLNIIN
jgi:hypothetical protein